MSSVSGSGWRKYNKKVPVGLLLLMLCGPMTWYCWDHFYPLYERVSRMDRANRNFTAVGARLRDPDSRGNAGARSQGYLRFKLTREMNSWSMGLFVFAVGSTVGLFFIARPAWLYWRWSLNKMQRQRGSN